MVPLRTEPTLADLFRGLRGAVVRLPGMATTPGEFLCVLRASSRAHGLGALLKTFPRWKPDACWKAGAPYGSRGRVHRDNGFNLVVTEGREWKQVLSATRRRLRAMAPMIEIGREFGASFQLDVGVMAERFYAEARFDPEDLGFLSSLGVELCISAYPVSDQPRPPTRRRARRSTA